MKRDNFCNVVRRHLGMSEDVNKTVTLDVQLESVNISQVTEDVSMDVISDVQLESDNVNQVTEDVSQDVQACYLGCTD